MYEQDTAYEYEKTDTPESPMAVAVRDLTKAVEIAQKSWEGVAMKLTPYLSKEEPAERENAVRALRGGTSNAIIELQHLVDQLNEFSDRMTRVQRRMEL